jgi:hypothetical protein
LRRTPPLRVLLRPAARWPGEGEGEGEPRSQGGDHRRRSGEGHRPPGGRNAGHHLSVALTDAAGRVTAQGGPLPVPAGGGSLTVPLPTMPVESVARVHTLLD